MAKQLMHRVKMSFAQSAEAEDRAARSKHFAAGAKEQATRLNDSGARYNNAARRLKERTASLLNNAARKNDFFSDLLQRAAKAKDTATRKQDPPVRSNDTADQSNDRATGRKDQPALPLQQAAKSKVILGQALHFPGRLSASAVGSFDTAANAKDISAHVLHNATMASAMNRTKGQNYRGRH